MLLSSSPSERCPCVPFSSIERSLPIPALTVRAGIGARTHTLPGRLWAIRRSQTVSGLRRK